MSFICDSYWQMLFLAACIAWLLLLLRELYRFRTLVSRCAALTLIVGGLALICWISLFFVMLVRTGVLSAIIPYALFFVLTALILGFAKSRRSVLFHAESLAQCDWEHTVHEAVIKKVLSRGDIQAVLSEYGQTMVFLQGLMERLIAVGHGDLVSRLGRVSNLRGVLEIHARNEYTDMDKMIGTVNYLLGAHGR